MRMTQKQKQIKQINIICFLQYVQQYRTVYTIDTTAQINCSGVFQ